MGRLGVLVSGELDRLKKYGLFQATIVVTLFWLVGACFMEQEMLKVFLPIIFLMEASLMTILLAGATMFYEKNEQALKSIIVTPATEQDYLFAKIAVNIINSMVSVVVISLAVYFMKGITFSYLLLIPAMVLVTTIHTLVGIKMAYHSPNFTSMLVTFFAYMVALVLPSIFAAFGVISGLAADLLFVLPPEASKIILGAAFWDLEPWRVLAAYGYLLVMAFVIYMVLVKPGFHNFAMQETGV